MLELFESKINFCKIAYFTIRVSFDFDSFRERIGWRSRSNGICSHRWFSKGWQLTWSLIASSSIADPDSDEDQDTETSNVQMTNLFRRPYVIIWRLSYEKYHATGRQVKNYSLCWRSCTWCESSKSNGIISRAYTWDFRINPFYTNLQGRRVVSEME